MRKRSIFLSQVFILTPIFALPVYAESNFPGNFPQGKPPLERCVENGKTEEECKAMFEEMRNHKGDMKEKMRGGMENEELRKPKGTFQEKPRAFIGQNRLASLEVRATQLIEYLDSKNIDTTEAKSVLETFRSKQATVQPSLDALKTAQDEYQKNNSEANKEILDTAREAAKEAMQGSLNYAKETMLPLLKELIQSLKK